MRERLAIEVDQGIGAEKVAGVLGRITTERRVPKSIRVDYGPESTPKVRDRRAYRNGVTLDFSRPGNPPTMFMWNRSTAACGTNA